MLEEYNELVQGVDIAILNFFAMPAMHACGFHGILAIACLPFPLHPSRHLEAPFFSSPQMKHARDALVARGGKRAPFLFWASLLWKTGCAPIAAWRKSKGMEPANPRLGHFADLFDGTLQTLYMYSPAVLKKMIDWPASASVCGFVGVRGKNPDAATASTLADIERLTAGKRRTQGSYYLGFGSAVAAVAQPGKVAASIMNALVKANAAPLRPLLICQRAFAQRAALEGVSLSQGSIPVPGAERVQVVLVDFVPFDLLFPHVTTVIYHGGAGTFGAACSSGCTHVILPVEFDNHWWGSRASDLGVGGCAVNSIDESDVLDAIRKASDPIAVARANDLQEKMRAEEDPVETIMKIVFSKLG